MPALPVIAHGFIVTQHYTAGGARHDFITRHTVVTTEPSHANIAASVALAIKNRVLLMMSNTVAMGNTDVLPLDGTSSTQTFTTASAGSAGGDAAGTALPYSSCFVTSWQTGIRGRSHRGRTYWPGVRSDRVVLTQANQLNAVDVTNLTTLSNAIITDLAALATPIQLYVLSLRLGTATFVTNARGNATLGVQRRRYEKVARH